MSASITTVKAIYAIIEKYIPAKAHRGDLLRELAKVKGNVSFRETVNMLIVVHEGRA